MNQQDLKDKLVWAGQLKPGDIVNNCASSQGVLTSIKSVEHKGQLVDFHVWFEDGSYCSAMTCCYPVDQPEKNIK